MTTIINTPPAQESSDSGVGIVLGVVLGLVLIVLFFVYVFPTLRGNSAEVPKKESIDVQITVPSSDTTPTPKP